MLRSLSASLASRRARLYAGLSCIRVTAACSACLSATSSAAPMIRRPIRRPMPTPSTFWPLAPISDHSFAGHLADGLLVDVVAALPQEVAERGVRGLIGPPMLLPDGRCAVERRGLVEARIDVLAEALRHRAARPRAALPRALLDDPLDLLAHVEGRPDWRLAEDRLALRVAAV